MSSGSLTFVRASCFCSEPSVANKTSICEEDRYGIPYTALYCNKCGLIYSKELPTEYTETLFYSKFYRDIYERPYQTDTDLFAQKLREGRTRYSKISRHLSAFNKSPTLLEIGCGGAWNIIPFLNITNLKATGVDFDDRYFTLALQHSSDLNLKRGNWKSLERQTYSFVLLIHVLEHFADPLPQLLHLISHHLNQNSQLIIEVPNSLRLIYPNVASRFFQSAHNYNFTPSTLLLLCSRAGLAIEYLDCFDNLLVIARTTLPGCHKHSSDLILFKCILKFLVFYEGLMLRLAPNTKKGTVSALLLRFYPVILHLSVLSLRR